MNLQQNRARVQAAMGTPPRAWYDIRNDTGRAVVRIFDEISWFGVTADEFASQLAAITAPEIVVEINSPGGNVFDGITIYNTLKNHPARITTHVVGLAASIASIIVQAGDQRIMDVASQMMVHRAWGACVGNATDMTDMAGALDKSDDMLLGIYTRRSGKPANRIRTLVDAETWLSAEEAVSEGLADLVTDTGQDNRTTNRYDDEAARALQLLNL